jgi:hypothetical protein
MGHHLVAAVIVTTARAGIPGLASSETLGEVYRRVNSSVVVIRARGQEVTREGTVRFREVGSGSCGSTSSEMGALWSSRPRGEGSEITVDDPGYHSLCSARDPSVTAPDRAPVGTLRG